MQDIYKELDAVKKEIKDIEQEHGACARQPFQKSNKGYEYAKYNLLIFPLDKFVENDISIEIFRNKEGILPKKAEKDEKSEELLERCKNIGLGSVGEEINKIEEVNHFVEIANSFYREVSSQENDILNKYYGYHSRYTYILKDNAKMPVKQDDPRRKNFYCDGEYSSECPPESVICEIEYALSLNIFDNLMIFIQNKDSANSNSTILGKILISSEISYYTHGSPYNDNVYKTFLICRWGSNLLSFEKIKNEVKKENWKLNAL